MEQISILIVDDEKNHAEAVEESLQKVGYRCTLAFSGKAGLAELSQEKFDIMITDVVMRDLDGIKLLNEAKKRYPDIEVIVMTGYPSVENAVEAMQKGAFTYLKKPVNIQELRQVVKNVLEKQQLVRKNIELHRQLEKKYGFEGIIGNSPQMLRIFEILQQIAETSVTVLIQGESGTGKELIARAIHFNSPRKNNHFVPLNCAALSESILESELFGHEKGAFTGAIYQRKGRFEYAHLGTLFLDEIGDMPISTQIKLLRVIETGEICRVGSNTPIKVDVRIIAATNQNLDELVKANKFRGDLYFRLKVVTLTIPPLRERKSDIPLLVKEFIKEANRLYHKNVETISPEALKLLMEYSWPGNVRELKNCIEGIVVTTRSQVIEPKDIPGYVLAGKEATTAITLSGGISLIQAERELIKNTLTMVNHNRAEAARILGIGERTLYRKLKKYNLT